MPSGFLSYLTDWLPSVLTVVDTDAMPVELEVDSEDTLLLVVDRPVDREATLLLVVDRPVESELIPVDTDVDILPIAWFVA